MPQLGGYARGWSSFFANAGLFNAFPEGEAREGWQYSFSLGFINLNSAATIFGWPLCFVVAWYRYLRHTKANRKQLLLLTCLPYLHVLLLVVSCLFLALLERLFDLGL
ncbi:hypothetical protein [Bythopirellula goksoeyrii]|uniref:hypothetical protein n=1 Tax=Bythopirellula goksoeyrii TaxID=1400387 RepID=UPI0011CE48CA|nr:hypothetical protein [Bythopirellula goksoeyrii]